MSRPKKETVEYFPHFVKSGGKTKSILRNRFGNDGYAFWFVLLEILGRSNGHYYNYGDTLDREYFLSETGVDAQKAEEIIELLVDIKKIDRELWEKARVIWVDNFVKNVQEVYTKRRVPAPKKPDWREFSTQKPDENGVFDTETTDKEEKETENTPEPEEEKPKKRTRKKPEEKEKKQYAEFVSMTEEEYAKLGERLGKDRAERAIEILDNYKGQNQKKHYDSDYRAILNWVIGRLEEEESRKGGQANAVSWGNHRQEQPAGGGFVPSEGFKK